jgi:hypothetical protein
MQFILPPAVQPSNQFGAVWEFENIWSDHKEIIKEIEREANDPTSGFYFTPAMTRGGSWTGPRRNLMSPISDIAEKGNELARSLHNRMGITLETALKSYSKHFVIEGGYQEPFSLLKYKGETKDHYDAHYDGSPLSRRWISGILYLNSDYEGGEIEFIHNDLKIKPTAGTLYLFPSGYSHAHIAHEVTKGTKYAIVTWIHDI